jgi:hypothetical protein
MNPTMPSPAGQAITEGRDTQAHTLKNSLKNTKNATFQPILTYAKNFAPKAKRPQALISLF